MDTPVIRIAAGLLFLGTSYYILTGWKPVIAKNTGSDADVATLMKEFRTDTDRGLLQQALVPAQLLYKAHPTNQVYIQQLASANQSLRRYKEAAALWEEFLQYAPLPSEACPQIGNAYRSDGQNEKAIEALKRCLTFDPRDPDVLAALGDAYSAVAMDADAADAYSRGLAVMPQDADLILGKARLDLRHGQTDAAAAAAAEVLKSTPDSSDALFLAGLVAERRGKLEEAQRDLEQAALHSTRDVDIQDALARVKAKLQKPGKADIR